MRKKGLEDRRPRMQSDWLGSPQLPTLIPVAGRIALAIVILTFFLETPFLVPAGPPDTQAASVGSVHLSTSPTHVTMFIGQMINVGVRLNGAVGLFAAEVHLSFDPTKVQVVDADATRAGVQVSPGDFFADAPSLEVKNSVDNTTGTIDYVETMLGSTNGADGSGSLMRVTFEGLAQGTTPLTFTRISLSSSTRAPIAHTSADGTLTVRTVEMFLPIVFRNSLKVPTPTPTATATDPPYPEPSTPTPTTTQTPTPTLTPTPGVSCTEFVTNGGFETNHGWEVPITACPARYTTENPFAGSRSLLLGIKPGEVDQFCFSSAWQFVDVPADIGSAALSFRYWLGSSEVDTSRDQQRVRVLNKNFQTLDTILLAGSDARHWQRRTFDLAPYAGQEIFLYFNVQNNGIGNRPTWMYVDEVSLLICDGFARGQAITPGSRTGFLPAIRQFLGRLF